MSTESTSKPLVFCTGFGWFARQSSEKAGEAHYPRDSVLWLRKPQWIKWIKSTKIPRNPLVI